MLGAAPAAALALYLDVVRADRESGGARLAALAKAVTALDSLMTGRGSAAPGEGILHRARGASTAEPAVIAVLATLPVDLRNTFLAAEAQRQGAASVSCPAMRRYTLFGGLFILLRSLDLTAIEEAIEAAADAAAASADLSPSRLVSFLTLAACAGRPRAMQILADPIWRELFGLPPARSAIDVAAELAYLPKHVWLALSSIGDAIATRADARFLLPPPALVGSREAARAIAKLARGVLSRFARRLPGFSDSSAPFLWHNLLAVSAAVDASDDGLTVLLDRCPLDVLLSISGIADASVSGPDGTTIRVRRRPL
jgi:hypothetical protein